MRFLCVLLVTALFSSTCDALGSIQAKITEITKQCCSHGTSYARQHAARDCKSSAPPRVPAAYGHLCTLAMDECCDEYFDKKRDCDNGIDTAIRRNNCDGTTSEAAKSCCQECLKGTAKDGTCAVEGASDVAEDMLLADAFTQCCKKSSKTESEKGLNMTNTQSKVAPLSADVSSICEEFAPTELCAHHCIPIPGSYRCECNPGYKLMADGKNCVEVVKNRCKPQNHCQHKCNDNGVEVKCSCRRGYQLQSDGKSCKDIDECSMQAAICPPGTQCKNTQGSYKCLPNKNNKEKGQCPPGFTRNNNVCDDINECTLPRPPCPSYLCENTVGGYKCGGVSGDPGNLPSMTAPAPPPAEDICPPGFKIGASDECEDVDECAAHKDDCNPMSQFCINTKGSFYCQDKVSKHCPPGFKMNPSSNKCEDIDECLESSSLCPADKVCVNVPGAYDCKLKADLTRINSKSKCPEGMRAKPGTSICEDIDECLEGTHFCDQHQHCINTNGSHECRCKAGFDLDVTTGACMDVNECATGQNECLSESQRCDNTVGSYICVRFISCGTGYILHHSTGNCDDIDECALGTHNCAKAGPQYQCKNIPGSFRCVRKEASTTSTTTLAPPSDYEYYYVDSDEEETNDTQSQTKPQPTQPPTTTTTTATTTTTTTETPIKTTPTTASTASTKPTVKVLTEPDILPEIPHETPETERRYEVDRPAEAEKPEIVKEPEVKQDTSKKTVNEVEIKPKKKEFKPKETEQKTPEIVFVSIDVPEETATVAGTQTRDGGILVQTQDVEKNTWTKISQKPEVFCQAGFEADEFGACVDIDECATHRHLCSGITEVCHNNLGGYICECAPGFRRDLMTRACDLIMTTTSTSTSTSTTTEVPISGDNKGFKWWGTPVNSVPKRPFRQRTICDAGFHMNKVSGVCEDINECTNGLAKCAAVEVCVNTEGGYRCECPPNWVLDELRHHCVPTRDRAGFPRGYKNIDRPGPTPGQPQVVVDTNNGTLGSHLVEPHFTNLGSRGAVFKCPWGYTLGDNNVCEDKDECALGLANCGPVQICTNLPGGYTCSCPPGHDLVGEHLCEDVNECALAGDIPICSQNSECLNTIGSYQCRCHEGFRNAPANDKICIDVDECSEARSGALCQHRCNNVWGGFKCSCHSGYRLNADNRSCSDVNECEIYKNKNVCKGQCINEPGSYRCTCPKGYRLAEDDRSCIDIDECENGEAICAHPTVTSGSAEICLNTRGGYKCERVTCLPGYRLENKHRCTKIDQHCLPSDWDCLHKPNTYSYNYITFASKLFIPDAVDLFTMRGPAWPNSRMKFSLRLVNVNAPPSVKKKADINTFKLTPTTKHAVVSIIESLEGPQSIELEFSMELYASDAFAGTAVAKIFIFVSEYEF